MPTRILAVEDEPDTATVLRLLFDPARFHVMLAGDLDGARAVLQRAPRPDLVLLDVVLPDGSGLDLCREVKAARPGLPVIILTALSRRQRGLEAQAWASGADVFLEKPFGPDDLQTLADGLLTAA